MLTVDCCQNGCEVYYYLKYVNDTKKADGPNGRRDATLTNSKRILSRPEVSLGRESLPYHPARAGEGEGRLESQDSGDMLKILTVRSRIAPRRLRELGTGRRDGKRALTRPRDPPTRGEISGKCERVMCTRCRDVNLL